MDESSTADRFSLVHGAGVSETIVRRIGELISAGELRPGERLPPETQLAAAFEVAPMTVRSALRVLREYGLLETRRGRGGGTFVREDAVSAPYIIDTTLPTLDEFEDFTRWRVAISGEAAALAAERFAAGTLDRKERIRLRELVEESHRTDVTPEEFRFADAELHRYITELSGSPRLVEAERSIQAQLTRVLRHATRPPNIVHLAHQSHTPLLDALLAGDPELSRHELRAHAWSSVDLMIGVGYLPRARTDKK